MERGKVPFSALYHLVRLFVALFLYIRHWKFLTVSNLLRQTMARNTLIRRAQGLEV